jgi:hypothetical protein
VFATKKKAAAFLGPASFYYLSSVSNQLSAKRGIPYFLVRRLLPVAFSAIHELLFFPFSLFTS